LIERNVEIGDRVRSGQQLARLDSQNEQSGPQAAKAQLLAAQVQLADARNNFTRMRNLIGNNAVSRASCDHSEALLRTAEAQVTAVKSQLGAVLDLRGYVENRVDVGPWRRVFISIGLLVSVAGNYRGCVKTLESAIVLWRFGRLGDGSFRPRGRPPAGLSAACIA
jgi:hypothetical protein